MELEIERKRKEKLDLQGDCENLRKEYQNERKDFVLFRGFKDELSKHDISITLVESVTDVIRIFKDLNFEPLKIIEAFSSISEYIDHLEQNKSMLKQLESYKHNLENIIHQNEIKLASREAMVQNIKVLEDLGFTTLDLKNLQSAISAMGKKYGLNETEMKNKFFNHISRFDNSLSLEKDITNKLNTSTTLDNEISLKRKIIESQPQLFSLLQYLLNQKLNEYDILNALKIFISDLMKTMPCGDETYLEDMSKNLKKYPTVKDALEALKTEKMLKESKIKQLTLEQSNMEVFRRLQLANIYFNFMILNVQMQIHRKFRIILIIPNSPLLLLIVVKDSKILDRINQKKEQNNKTNNKNKEARKGNKKKV